MRRWMAPLRHLSAKLLSDRISSEWEPSMGEVTTTGFDWGNHFFQVPGVEARGGWDGRRRYPRTNGRKLSSATSPHFPKKKVPKKKLGEEKKPNRHCGRGT